jgi:hypothetical protein
MDYPTSVDSFTVVNGTTLLSTGHADLHNQVGSAVIALENKVGLGAGTPTLNKVLVGSGNGTAVWGTVIDNITMGTPSITGGTITSSLLGTNQITGGTVTSVLVSGGTLANNSIGTPTIIGGTIAINGTVTPLNFGAAIIPSLGSVADAPAGTITVNAQQSNFFYSVLGTTAGNRTVGTPLNPTALQSLTFGFKTSGSANGTILFDTGAFIYSQDSGTLSLGTGVAWHYYSWRYNPVASKWHFMGQIKNVI